MAEQEPSGPVRLRSAQPFVEWQGSLADYLFGMRGLGVDGVEYALTVVAEPLTRHGVHKPMVGHGFGFRDSGAAVDVPVKEFLQAIVDEAYRAGIRPSPEVADSDARKAHLEDMRRLVFDLLPRVKGAD